MTLSRPEPILRQTGTVATDPRISTHEAETIPELLKERASLSPTDIAHWTLDQAGLWRPTTWQDYSQQVRRLARGFQHLGLAPRDRLGILAPSWPEWELIHMGALATGAVIVGLDLHDKVEQVVAIVEQSELNALAVSDARTLDRLPHSLRRKLKFEVIIRPSPGSARDGHLIPLAALLDSELSDAAFSVPPLRGDAAATIVFTSGTTGAPKGILYTHSQVCLASRSILDAFSDLDEHTRLVCWLPLSNLFQRMVNICAMVRGAPTYFVENPKDILEHLPSIKPKVFIGVPRFFEKLHTGILSSVEREPRLARLAFRLALRVGDVYARALRAGVTPPVSTRLLHTFLDRVVLRRVRSSLGGDIKYMISGSAPMPLWLLERFHAIGFLILEAYGLSENIIPVATNRPYDFRFGTVGKPLKGNQVAIAPDGEILVRGPGLCSGYLKASSTTAPITPDAYLATGDFGRIDDGGYIHLTGRKSDILKTSTGRRVAPAPIEALLRQTPYVDHAAVFCNGRMLYAVISISSSELRQHLGLTDNAVNPLIAGADAVCNDLQRLTSALPQHERPTGLILTTRAFTPDTGELTASLKLRRHRIASNFAHATAALSRLPETFHTPSRACAFPPEAEDILVCTLQ